MQSASGSFMAFQERGYLFLLSGISVIIAAMSSTNGMVVESSVAAAGLFAFAAFLPPAGLRQLPALTYFLALFGFVLLLSAGIHLTPLARTSAILLLSLYGVVGAALVSLMLRFIVK